jgi:hypothetical protein
MSTNIQIINPNNFKDLDIETLDVDPIIKSLILVIQDLQRRMIEVELELDIP